MENINNYKHKFLINSNEIELTINHKDGLWTSEITKGVTEIGKCSGGKYGTLEEYISAQETQHRYSFNFFLISMHKI
jgi:hypothetical protein